MLFERILSEHRCISRSPYDLDTIRQSVSGDDTTHSVKLTMFSSLPNGFDRESFRLQASCVLKVLENIHLGLYHLMTLFQGLSYEEFRLWRPPIILEYPICSLIVPFSEVNFPSRFNHTAQISQDNFEMNVKSFIGKGSYSKYVTSLCRWTKPFC